MSFTRSLIARRRDQEEGFTLIELMVVVLIIAILIAIAIPTFLGARSRAQDRAAQSDIRNGLTAEKTVYTDNQTYSAVTATMQGVEPSLNWNNATPGRPALTVTTDATNNNVCLTETSKSGTVFSLADVGSGVGAGTYYNKTGVCDTAVANLTALNGWSQTGW